MIRSIAFAALLCLAVWPTLAVATPLQSARIVALEDDPTPSGDGSLWLPLSRFVLNDAGQVAWVSLLKDASGGADTQALLSWDAGTLTEIIRSGDPLPGSTVPFRSLRDLALGDAGSILIDRGFEMHVWDGSTFEVANDPNAVAPDGDGRCCSPGERTNFNSAGQVAFVGHVHPEGSPAEDAAFLYNGSGIDILLREGEDGPAGDGVIVQVQPQTPALNEAGQVAVVAEVGVAGRPKALFRWTDGALEELIREGDPVSGRSSPVSQSELIVSGINDSGQVLLGSLIVDETGATPVVLPGQPAPDGNGRVRLPSYNPAPALNNAGSVLFDAFVSETADSGSHEPGDNQGLFLYDGSTILQLAREGSPVPEGEGVFAFFFDVVNIPTYYALNNQNQAAFRTEIRGTENPDDHGLFFYDPSHGVIQLGRPGDSLFGSTIAGLNLSGWQSEEFTGLNDAGELLFLFTLEDGRTGLAIWSAPEPSSVLLLALAALAPGWYVRGKSASTSPSPGTRERSPGS